MTYVGIDVAVKSSQVHVFDPTLPEGRQHRSRRVETTAEAFGQALADVPRDCVIAFEVGTQAQWLRGVLTPWCGRLLVLNPSQMPWIFRDHRKNDRLDARKLALAAYFGQVPEVYLPTAEVSGWRHLINYRRQQVRGRTILKNQIRAILRSQALRCPVKSCWSRAGRAWIESQVPLFDRAHQVTLKDLLRRLVQSECSLRQTERELDEIATQHPGVALLRSIPGVGPRTAEAIVAYTGEVQRFRSRKHYTSYFGMTPKEDSSGECVRRGRISKRGPSVVRWVVIEAAQCAVRRCPALRAYAQRIAKGRKDRWKKAIVATGRKLLAICYGMLKRDERFDVRRLPQPAA